MKYQIKQDLPEGLREHLKGHRFMLELMFTGTGEEQKQLKVSAIWDMEVAYTVLRDGASLHHVMSAIMGSLEEAAITFYKQHELYCKKGCLDQKPFACPDSTKWHPRPIRKRHQIRPI